MKPRLGVNIDHVATLRQARGESYPEVGQAADMCLASGADQITIHLREDRRHIQDADVFTVAAITRQWNRPLNLEMGANRQVLEVALRAAPQWICLVPEKRLERTTEGGLDLMAHGEGIAQLCQEIKESAPQTKVSLFVEADMKVLDRAATMGTLIDAVEIHTGAYARSFLARQDWRPFLADFAAAAGFLDQASLGCHAGHGLTQESLAPLLAQGLFEEYNIGHWVIGQALFEGLGEVVGKLKRQMGQ